MKKRILILDEKTERALTAVCDTALRFAGMHMASLVADVATSIRDTQEGDDSDW
ncbi:MAG: hypothetical protein V4487_08570 [Chlamydiota bacterium]